MVRDPVRSEDSPELQTILDALDDQDCRAIVSALDGPMTADEVADAADVPLSTTYRKLDLLTEASLLEEGIEIRADGRTTRRPLVGGAKGDMSSHTVVTPTAIVAVKTITLLLGALITYFSFKTYRRTGARSLRALAAGFGVVTLGSLLAGVLDQVFRLQLQIGLFVESSLLAVGFAIIVYSLYVE
jgi:hypothetical protein